MTQPIRIRYTPSPEAFREVMTLAVKSRRHRPFVQFLLGVLGGGVVGGALVYGLWVGLRFNPEPSHFVAFGLGAVLVLAMWQVQHHKAVAFASAQAEAVGVYSVPIEAEFGPEGVRLTSDLGNSSFPWLAVLGMLSGQTCVGVQIGATLLPVPLAALPEGMAAQAFIDRLESWRTAA